MNKIALLAATASLTIAGAAFAQSTTTTTTQAPMPTPSTPTGPVQSTTTTTAMPGQPAQSTTTTTQSTAPSAGQAASPASTTAVSYKVGSAVKDAQGVGVGQITGTSTGADGATNVIVTNGGVKFALPANSLSAMADGGVQTTATKAQIDATVAGAKPQ